MLIRFFTILYLFLSLSLNASEYKHYDIAFPRAQMEKVCEVVGVFSNIPNKEVHLVSGQLANYGDCIWEKGNREEAMKFWLLAADNGSLYALETAARIKFAQAKNENEVIATFILFQLLGVADKSKRNLYHLYKGMAYVGNRHIKADIDFALIQFNKAVELGSVEAALLYAHFVGKGLIPVKDANKTKSEWIKKAKVIDPKADFDQFMVFAKLSDGYVL